MLNTDKSNDYPYILASNPWLLFLTPEFHDEPLNFEKAGQ